MAEFKNGKKKAVLKFYLLLACVVFTAMAIVGTILTIMATNRDNEPQFIIQQENITSSFPESLFFNANKDVTLTEDEVNFVLKNQVKLLKEKDRSAFHLVTHNVSVRFFDEQSIEIYCDIEYSDIRLIVKMIGKVSLDNKNKKIKFKINESYVGLIPIPVETIFDFLKQSDFDAFWTGFLKMETSGFSIPLSYFNEQKREFEINSFEIFDSKVIINK